jgi:large repetitive protein
MKRIAIVFLFCLPCVAFAQRAKPHKKEPLVIHGLPCPKGYAGQQYICLLTATGGEKPYDWALTAKSLPAGLQLYVSKDTTIAVVYGVPKKAGDK